MRKKYLLKLGGAYYCHRCGSNGSWYDFKNKLSGWFVHGKGSKSQMGGGGTSSASYDGKIGIKGGGDRIDRTRRTNDDGVYGNNKPAVAPLPMSPKRLNLLDIARLFGNDRRKKEDGGRCNVDNGSTSTSLSLSVATEI
jgi:hypothetical protein